MYKKDKKCLMFFVLIQPVLNAHGSFYTTDSLVDGVSPLSSQRPFSNVPLANSQFDWDASPSTEMRRDFGICYDSLIKNSLFRHGHCGKSRTQPTMTLKAGECLSTTLIILHLLRMKMYKRHNLCPDNNKTASDLHKLILAHIYIFRQQ